MRVLCESKDLCDVITQLKYSKVPFDDVHHMFVQFYTSKSKFYFYFQFAGVWDAVVTCFFLDTAHNIVEYIEIISRILKDGGVSILNEFLVNLFHIHFDDTRFNLLIGLDKFGAPTLSLCRYLWSRRCKFLV